MTETSKHIDVFYSFDKGNSWTVIENISGEGSADPVICFDQDGIALDFYLFGWGIRWDFDRGRISLFEE
ncbi:hypothetical protein ACX8XP_06840 [Calditrichota bacterium LG25]